MQTRWIDGFKGHLILAVLALAAFAGLTTAAAPAPAGSNSAPSAAVAQIDINTASTSELVEIPGIGPATAERIVAWREQNGSFRSVEDLMKVRGIAEKSMEKLRPYVKVAKAK